MQNPVGSAFNPDTMRMEASQFQRHAVQPVAQVKFVHTVSASLCDRGDVRAGDQRLVSAQAPDRAFAHRSFATAAAFGLA